MKILYLCADAGVPVLGRKGASVHVREMAEVFSRAGHQVVLVAQVLNKSPWEQPAEVSAQVLQVRPTNHAQSAVQAVKDFQTQLGLQGSLPGELRRILYNQELTAELVRRFDGAPPDFIYERAALYSTTGANVARRLNVPLLLELNAPLAVEQSAYRGNGLGALSAQAEQWVLGQADAVLTVSAQLRQHVLSLGVAPEKIHVVPNGVNASLFHPGPRDAELRAQLGLGDGPVLGFVGGLRPWHGIEALPALLASLLDTHPSLRMLLVGDGSLRDEFQDSLRVRGLTDHVVFAGAVPHEDVPALIRQFDIALAPYPALNHDFYFSPLKVFEYMACGVVTVASHCGQLTELIRDGETGVLYPPGDLNALTAACAGLLNNPKRRSTLGQSAAHHVRENFTWERNAQRAVELARELAGLRAAVRPA
jgi:glycosyltransferase involved in cell wall biosynthesis